MARYASVLGLGFGDCGKGLFTDFLCRRGGARTVVRFNGGAQAGHNVVLPDGRHHTFSQFGSGTFLPGVRTVLAAPVVVHPSALLVEEGFLRRAGVTDALPRLRIDGRCLVNTPFHQAAGRLREALRGGAAHGTCGVGFGETVRHSLDKPALALRYGSLPDTGKALASLAALQADLRAEFAPRRQELPESEWRVLADESLPRRWLEGIRELLRSVPPSDGEALGRMLREPGAAVFEGAQGILLDEWKGFHPHTTWSSTHAGAVEALAAEWDLPEPVRHFGVLRTYLTRHGAGPLPTHDPALDALAEPHNGAEGWQGAFRRGHPDEVLLRYALEAVGPLAGLLVSHLDAPARAPGGLRWCGAYETPAGHRIDRLPVTGDRDLAKQEALTGMLRGAKPCYEPHALRDAGSLLERFAGLAGVPVLAGSRGNSHAHVEVLSPDLE